MNLETKFILILDQFIHNTNITFEKSINLKIEKLVLLNNFLFGIVK